MNSILIPRYSIVGGALSALASEALIFTLAWMAIAKLVPFSPWSPIIRPALAAGGMGVLLWLLPALSFLEAISLGAASYSVLLFLFGAIRLSELREAWRAR